jgi:chemotaxis protein CheX
MTERLELEARLDLTASERLVTQLAEARGKAITLDASAVDHLGAHAVQTLLVARTAWERDQNSFVIEALSDRAGAALATLGIDPAELSWEASI